MKSEDAKDRRLVAPRLHNFQHIIGFLRGQRTNQPFVQNQQVFLLIRFEHLFQCSTTAGNAQFVQQLWHKPIIRLWGFSA